MNPRNLLSGPSRLRPLLSSCRAARPSLGSSSSSRLTILPTSSALLQPVTTSYHSRRTLITFPHPDLDPSKGSTKLVVRTFDGIPSLVHAYAIIKAIEAKLGTEILDLYIAKDQDAKKLGPTIFLTTLKPVQLDSALLLEIPSPAISSESNFLGGPSWNDISKILSTNTASETVITSAEKLTKNPTGKDTPLQFRVEVQRKPIQAQRRADRGIKKRVRYSQDSKEGRDIVEALKQFEGGFFGGFEGLADKFDSLGKGSEGVQAGTTGTGQPAPAPKVEEPEEAAVDVEQVKQPFQAASQ
ncbi:hypothetical protein I316_03042 [Kwoniella heveanensis BCC8398]|uniref:Uncharacterized protein n=1 Tax=Kwoniella heveanensis BCC8398 TaxID=1296120 RepID=A0A1B9GVF6_9TREE|nr:hypothetical protein I316_03042 [Kwoniella heveanensis BCC8398]